MIMNKICNCKSCQIYRDNPNVYYNKLLYFWNKIELYNQLVKESKLIYFQMMYRSKRDFYKYLLKFVLGIECIGVYDA